MIKRAIIMAGRIFAALVILSYLGYNAYLASTDRKNYFNEYAPGEHVSTYTPGEIHDGSDENQ